MVFPTVASVMEGRPWSLSCGLIISSLCSWVFGLNKAGITANLTSALCSRKRQREWLLLQHVLCMHLPKSNFIGHKDQALRVIYLAKQVKSPTLSPTLPTNTVKQKLRQLQSQVKERANYFISHLHQLLNK